MAATDVTLIYEGKDITGRVMVAQCVHKDVSRGVCDCLDIRLEEATTWMGWGPQTGDSIRVQRSGYDSGTLYVNTIIPEDRAFRILATAMKPGAKRVRYGSYQDKTLMQIMSMCAAECGMGIRLYGINGNIRYNYLIREHETAPAFMSRIARHEGAILKAINGNFAVIGIEYAQSLKAGQKIILDMTRSGIRYIDNRESKWTGAKIVSPWCTASATDSAGRGEVRTFTNLSLRDGAQAKRWAKGLLLDHNRQAEILVLEMVFNPGMTAACRVDITGNSSIGGTWITDAVEHDFMNDATRIWLMRCITTIF